VIINPGTALTQTLLNAERMTASTAVGYIEVTSLATMDPRLEPAKMILVNWRGKGKPAALGFALAILIISLMVAA